MNVEKSFIDLSDIIRYIGYGTRSYVEGERVYKANHIIFYGLAKEIMIAWHLADIIERTLIADGHALAYS